ncbi:hypothetical protein K2173_020896 [Erythroxylum novogranatense]|uniref:DUF7950 domain-containing protein n=1 Tax=Erythroxylum novogranatense TaxID=1862640 RepID=A0AAV8TNC1_9ROSI|nr:hypothetical protein K2173_020896 [Erythroxylum novogranatense]
MDGTEGWRVVTCAAHPGQDKTIINRIMLRFRPIAPKPATGDNSSTSWNSANNSSLLSKGRNKRKYVRVKKNNESYKRRRRKTPPSSDREKLREDDQSKKTIALELLPVKTDLAQKPSFARPGTVVDGTVTIDVKTSFGLIKEVVEGVAVSDPKGLAAEKRVVDTTVRVESVTDTCIDRLGLGSLGCTDVDRMKNLETDTCPCFISDFSNTVLWINEAYKDMVVGEEASASPSPPPEVRVGLVIKEKLTSNMLWASAFTCWVRLQKEKSATCMVPCDVWRMEFGGFAWRLDVKAALSLAL